MLLKLGDRNIQDERYRTAEDEWAEYPEEPGDCIGHITQIIQNYIKGYKKSTNK